MRCNKLELRKQCYAGLEVLPVSELVKMALGDKEEID
jgi:hypothetical protein